MLSLLLIARARTSAAWNEAASTYLARIRTPLVGFNGCESDSRGSSPGGRTAYNSRHTSARRAATL
eukprot:7386352-Prymnesium_polylepis.1